MITLKETWVPLYYASRTPENWIIPHSEKDKHFRAMGVITAISPDYLDCVLKGTGVNIRNEVNNYVYFFGHIPDSLLGKAVDVEQRIIEEGKDSYLVEQRIFPLDPLIQYEEKIFHSSTFPKEAACNMMLCAVGEFPKK